MSQQVGSRRSPLLDRSLQSTLGNKATTVNGTRYTAHAQDAVQNGGIYPSMVQSTIRSGKVGFGRDGAIIYDDIFNTNAPLRVITNIKGDVITTYWR